MRRLLDAAHRFTGDDQFAQFVVEQQHLGHRLAALVARPPAAGAAPARTELKARGVADQGLGQQNGVWHVVRRTVGAVHPHQTLRNDAIECGHQAVGIHAHVGEAAEHVEHVVGVHRGQHQVAGEGGLYRDLRGLAVADFADHDLVRVVAQDGAQAARKRQAFLFVDRDLKHAAELVLHRVLDGDDLVVPAVDLVDGGVQRGGLAAAGGAGGQNHAVGLLAQRAQLAFGDVVKTQGFEPQAGHLV